FHSLLSSTCLHSPSSSTLSTLSLHDALPIYRPHLPREPARRGVARRSAGPARRSADRTRRGGGAGPLARTAAVRLRPLPAALLLPARRPARQPAGPVEPLEPSAVVLGLPLEHQCADGLLARRGDRPPGDARGADRLAAGQPRRAAPRHPAHLRPGAGRDRPHLPG